MKDGQYIIPVNNNITAIAQFAVKHSKGELFDKDSFNLARTYLAASKTVKYRFEINNNLIINYGFQCDDDCNFYNSPQYTHLNSLEELITLIEGKQTMKRPYVKHYGDIELAKFICRVVRAKGAINERTIENGQYGVNRPDHGFCINPNKTIEWCHLRYYEGNPNDFELITIDELVKRFSKPLFKEVRLGNSQTVHIYKDKLMVGCNHDIEVPLSVIDEIQAAVKELNS